MWLLESLQTITRMDIYQQWPSYELTCYCGIFWNWLKYNLKNALQKIDVACYLDIIGTIRLKKKLRSTTGHYGAKQTVFSSSGQTKVLVNIKRYRRKTIHLLEYSVLFGCMMYLRCMFNGGIEDKHGGPNRNGEDDATSIIKLFPQKSV